MDNSDKRIALSNKFGCVKIFKILRIFLEGLLLLWFSVWLFFYVDEKYHQQDEITIDMLYLTFEGDIREENFIDAYMFMSPTYKAENSLDEFCSDFRFIQEKIYRLSPQRYILFLGNKAQLRPQGLKQPPGYWRGSSLELEKIGNEWYFTGNLLISQD